MDEASPSSLELPTFRKLAGNFIPSGHIAVLLLLGPLAAFSLHSSLRSSSGDGLDATDIALLASAAVLIFALHLSLRPPPPVYVVDFSCYKPPSTCRVPHAAFLEHSRHLIAADSVAFQHRILERSGIGEETGLPPQSHYLPPTANLSGSREESELVIYGAVDELLRKTGVDPRSIDILVINCNSFSPTPSLTSMVVNRYKMRSDVLTFNLSGMGCSASPISVGLARDQLQLLRQRSGGGGVALVVSTEIIVSPNWYMGSERSMLISNCLFRLGGAAVLLSNRPSDRRRSKYRLLHVVRTHTGADDRAYRCLYQVEDSEGKQGISLSKDVMPISGDALKINLTRLLPLVLPASEKLRFAASLAASRLLPASWGFGRIQLPKVNKAFDHYCVHAGGRAVIDEVERRLRLSPEQVEASRMTLYRFGNTSSSSIWYELAYTEAKGRVRKGDRVWQLGLGSGFKCNSEVLVSLRTVAPPKDGEGPWGDCIGRYPVKIPDIIDI